MAGVSGTDDTPHEGFVLMATGDQTSEEYRACL